MRLVAPVFGTAPTIRTRDTCRLSLNCGGGAKTGSDASPLCPAHSNSGGGGGRLNSSLGSISIGGGSWARETACLESNPEI